MTLPPNLNIYISAALFVLGAYLFALYLGLIVWTVRDVRSRTRDVLGQILATLLVAVFTLPGLLIYVLLRPHTTLAEEYERNLAEEAILQDLEDRRICPGCHRRVEPDFVVCPDCHFQLRYRCTGCTRLLNPHWEVCPYCGLARAQDRGPETGKGHAHPARRAQAQGAPVHVPEAVPPLAPLPAQDAPRDDGSRDVGATDEAKRIPLAEQDVTEGVTPSDEPAAALVAPWALEEETASAEEPSADRPAIVVEAVLPAEEELAVKHESETADDGKEAAAPASSQV